MRLVYGVLSLNVYASDRRLENADLGACAAGLDYTGLFLDADDLSDDTADGGYLVANLKVVAHVCNLLILLFLLARAEEEDSDQCNDHYYQENSASDVSSGRSEHKQIIKHILLPFCLRILNIFIILQIIEIKVNGVIVNFLTKRQIKKFCLRIAIYEKL